jgi:hypothetical protein
MLSLAVADLDASANLIDASAVDRAREADSVAPQTRVGPDRMTPDRDPGLFHLVITAGVATARDDEQKSYQADPEQRSEQPRLIHTALLSWLDVDEAPGATC